jgi:hypothetical protein
MLARQLTQPGYSLGNVWPGYRYLIEWRQRMLAPRRLAMVAILLLVCVNYCLFFEELRFTRLFMGSVAAGRG